MAHARRRPPHAPRSTRRGGGRGGAAIVPTRTAIHVDGPRSSSPHTHRRLSNQPQRRLVSRQAAVRLVCACWRGRDTRSVCIAPVLSRCTAPHRVLYSPSGALLSGRAAPCRTLLPIGCSSVQVYCFPSGTLPPIGHSAPRRRTAPPSGALLSGCSASHRARCPLSGSPLPIRCTTPVHPAETTSRGSGDRARHTPWLA